MKSSVKTSWFKSSSKPPQGLLIPLAAVLSLSVSVVAPRASAQTETCDRFSFAVSDSRLNEIPVTVLRGGMSPVLEIAGQTYNYDTGTHCIFESGTKIDPLKKPDCTKPLKVMSGKKVVALIEGRGRVSISVADAKGQRDATQPHYDVFVERDPSNPTRPRFVLEAMGVDGKTLGRIDGIEGLTAPDLTKFKGKLASAHGLIDLRAKNLVYANCRKLAVMRLDSGTPVGADRAVASAAVRARGGRSSSTLAMPKLNALSSASMAPPPQDRNRPNPMKARPARR